MKKYIKNMQIGVDKKQTELIKYFKQAGVRVVPLKLRDAGWVKEIKNKKCDAYVWFPDLHHKWFKLLDRAGFIELFENKRIFPSLKDSYLFQNKLHQKYFFDYYKIPHPRTTVITTPEELDKYVSCQKNYPFLIKDAWGFGGDAPKLKNPGIQIIKNKKQALEFQKNKKWPKYRDWINNEDYIYIQELVDVKKEYRVVTVGQKIVLSYEKKSDEILKHVWRGAKIIYDKNKRVEDFVKKINKKTKLDWCGWDIVIDQNNKIKVLELNTIFGKKVLQDNKISIEKIIVDYVVKQIKLNK